MSALCDIAQILFLAVDLATVKYGKSKQISGSAENHARFGDSVFIKEEMYLKKKKPLTLGLKRLIFVGMTFPIQCWEKMAL